MNFFHHAFKKTGLRTINSELSYRNHLPYTGKRIDGNIQTIPFDHGPVVLQDTASQAMSLA